MSNKENYGPGGFSDQYDNEHMRSVDRDQHPGGVTGVHFDEDYDFNSIRSVGQGEAYRYPGKRMEPDRGIHLGRDSTSSWDSSAHKKTFRGMGPKGWELSDEKLKERVSEVLLHSSEVDPSELEVSVKERIVYLKGNIRSKGMRRVAEDLVGSIPGVEDVFTELKISETSNFQIK